MLDIRQMLELEWPLVYTRRNEEVAKNKVITSEEMRKAVKVLKNAKPYPYQYWRLNKWGMKLIDDLQKAYGKDNN